MKRGVKKFDIMRITSYLYVVAKEIRLNKELEENNSK
jgi:hypothetical protein